jgi:hypothetical protein
MPDKNLIVHGLSGGGDIGDPDVKTVLLQDQSLAQFLTHSQPVANILF